MDCVDNTGPIPTRQTNLPLPHGQPTTGGMVARANFSQHGTAKWQRMSISLSHIAWRGSILWARPKELVRRVTCPEASGLEKYPRNGASFHGPARLPVLCFQKHPTVRLPRFRRQRKIVLCPPIFRLYSGIRSSRWLAHSSLRLALKSPSPEGSR